jgi:flap endonuclease-1
MGVNLTPIIVKKIVNLEELKCKSLAVDANNVLYQFLSLIRTPDGTPLMDSKGNVTSHLVGLMFRSTRLIHDYGIKLVFVFDGKPPKLKDKEIEKRREARRKALSEWEEALKVGDYAAAWSKAVMTSRLTKPLIEDSKKLLELLGIPYFEAPSEGEAQTAYMAMKGDVWASNSRDYDSILFGAPRLVRYVTISGKEFLPSKGTARPLKPEIISLEELLSYHGITREQLVDLAIIVGTDFNEGIKGIGPKTALKLIREHGKLENLPEKIRSKLPAQCEEIRKIFLKPEVSDDYSIEWGNLRETEIYEFLCHEKGFSKKRVEIVIQRMKKFYSNQAQASLGKWT